MWQTTQNFFLIKYLTEFGGMQVEKIFHPKTERSLFVTMKAFKSGHVFVCLFYEVTSRKCSEHSYFKQSTSPFNSRF